MAVTKIDTHKLRKLMIERKTRSQVVQHLTDRYLDLRKELVYLTNNRPGAVEADLSEEELQALPERERVGGMHRLSPDERKRIRDLRADIQFAQQQRQEAEQRFHDMAFVDGLVEYARSLGYRIDTETVTIESPRLPDDRGFSPGSNFTVAIQG